MTLHPRFLLRGLAVWPALPLAAVAAGALRERMLAPVLGQPAAQWAGAATALVLFYLIACAFLARVRTAPGAADLWALGILWAGLAAGFEAVFFGLVMGVPAAQLRAAYDVTAGATWPWVLLGVLIAPRVVARIAGRRAR